MRAWSIWGVLGAAVWFLSASPAHAECSKDTECKGERVCEAGSCVYPSQPVAAATSPTATSPTTVTPAKPALKRHSTGLLAGGIVMVSLTPVALLVAWVANIEQSKCEGDDFWSGSIGAGAGVNCDRYDPTIYGGLISAAPLLGAGIPMIVIGGKKEPVGTASLTPWASPHAAGVGLRIDL